MDTDFVYISKILEPNWDADENGSGEHEGLLGNGNGNGNAHYAAFHNLNASVGFQALLLPVAFSFLGWQPLDMRWI
ncbi:unnamed protein product [Cuscuta epithymum]|uniref:Uncharacterized protein n=1 Tax=Cuscuta epithymum TaxID=186058 RepID=A0AAV0DK22_9ASTE|nr:unnamed protein product [Cuscuta epithymum]